MIITNHLTPSQTAKIAVLEGICKEYDSLKGSLFLSNELNFDPELPCFYLLYEPDGEKELIACLSIFAPAPSQAEIYACTAPRYRQRGCFNVLLEAALHTLTDYGIPDVLFVHEPACAPSLAVLGTLDAVYQYSEYLLTLPQSVPLFPSALAGCGLSLLPASSQELPLLAGLHARAFQGTEENSRQFLADAFSSGSHGWKLTDMAGTLIGICFFSVSGAALSVFSVAIHPDYRRHSYAFSMLQALFARLREDYPGYAITLEVSSMNAPAFALYRKLGFQIATQFDYSYADSTELLELF